MDATSDKECMSPAPVEHKSHSWGLGRLEQAVEYFLADECLCQSCIDELREALDAAQDAQRQQDRD